MDYKMNTADLNLLSMLEQELRKVQMKVDKDNDFIIAWLMSRIEEVKNGEG
jgi:hypothetical protein